MTKHFLLALLMTAPLTSLGQLQVTRLVSDGMVLQRGLEVPVWGWTTAGNSVEVMFEGGVSAAIADEAGRWEVRLPSMPAGGPHRMTISSGTDRVEVSDILVGDVWICSGQSNMEWVVANSIDAENEIAGATDTSIRHFKVPRSWSEQPEETLTGGTWEVADPEHVGEFTAVGYFFAREMRKHHDIPIGLLHTSWGGSRLEPWMSAEALGMDADAISAAMQVERDKVQRVLGEIRARLGKLPERDEGLVGGIALWADPSLDDSKWADIKVPAAWEQAGFPGMDGTAWYRTSFDLSADEATASVRLGLGMIDDSDVTWVNGKEVGRMDMAWNRARVYEVPASALTAGRNVIAVRVEDTGGGGGIQGDPDLLYMETGGRRQSLAGTWKFEVGAVSTNLDGGKNQVPMVLYNKMVHPLIDYPIAGALWYQGESNAGPQDAYEYRNLFKEMIADWRARWNVGDFPFLFVQLANWEAEDVDPAESAWAVLRESQNAALSLPNTAQAVAIDIGESADIHPRNKQDVGRRLALAARKMVFGEDIVYSGPTYRSHLIDGARVSLSFDHVGGGLKSAGADDLVAGFVIAGPDRRFVQAHAEIAGNRIRVWSDEVKDPVAVRYAWDDDPVNADLYNAEGLPASPFRTDCW